MAESPGPIPEQGDTDLKASSASVDADGISAQSTSQEDLVPGEVPQATAPMADLGQTDLEPAHGVEGSSDALERAEAVPTPVQESAPEQKSVASVNKDDAISSDDVQVHTASRLADTITDAPIPAEDRESETLDTEASKTVETNLTEVHAQGDEPSAEESPTDAAACTPQVPSPSRAEKSDEPANKDVDSTPVVKESEEIATPAPDEQSGMEYNKPTPEISEMDVEEAAPTLPEDSLGQEVVKEKEPADLAPRDPLVDQGIASVPATDNEDTNSSFPDSISIGMSREELLQAKPAVAGLDTATDQSGRSTPNLDGLKDLTGRDSPSVRSGRDSPSSQRPRRRIPRDSVVTEANEANLGIFPAENLFEYQWPEEKGAEWYFVQEQISEFLQVKSFKRKYPDLERRVMDINEKDFLRERGVVTEEQVTLGLTALRADEVYDLMLKDAPDKSAEYARVLHEKEKQNISNKHKQYEAPSVDSNKVQEYVKKAVKQAAEYNSALMAERREERLYYFDMQTLTVQMPASRMKKYDKASTKIGPYPVAVIPGQYQNYFRSYSADELKYFPLNTAIYGPMAPCRQTDIAPPQSRDEIDGLSDNDTILSTENLDSSSDMSNRGRGTPMDIAQDPVELASDMNDSSINIPSVQVPVTYKPLAVQDVEPSIVIGLKRPKDIPDAICGLCLKDRSMNKMGVPEKMIHCSQCDNSGHPSCLDMTQSMVEVIQTYPWQCMECKTCFHCGDPTHEDKMMFCDMCDRGYHTFCVGLLDIPTGLWACQSCQTRDVPATLEPHVPTPPQSPTPPMQVSALEPHPALPMAESTPASRKRGRRAATPTATPTATPKQGGSANKKGKSSTPTPKRIRKK